MKRSILLVLVVLFASACTTRYIDNTRIEDTEENRELIQVVKQYRQAVEDRDLNRILDMTSDRYFEDPGTPHDPTDDYDKAGLKARLEQAFGKVKEQRLAMDVRRIQVNDEENEALVDFRFDFRYRLDLPSGDEWRERSDLNRLELRREGDDWKITSGL